MTEQPNKETPIEQTGRQDNEPSFMNILQNPPINAVMSLGDYSAGEIYVEAQERGLQVTKYQTLGNDIYFQDIIAKDMNTATLKIFLFMQNKIAQDLSADVVRVNIAEYMQETGIQKRGNAWKHLEHAGNVLMNTCVEGVISKRNKDNTVIKVKMPICVGADRAIDPSKKVRADYFTFIPSTEYKRLCRYNAYVAPIHRNILKVPNSNPVAVRFGYKMCIHYNINKPKGHGNSNTIKVKSLLEACQDIPPYEAVSAHYRQRIIKPVEDNLQVLADYNVIKDDFIFTGPNGAPLRTGDMYELTFAEFAECNVVFNFTDDYAEQTKPQLEHAGKLIEKRAKAKQKRKERQERRVAEAYAKLKLKQEQEREQAEREQA